MSLSISSTIANNGSVAGTDTIDERRSRTPIDNSTERISTYLKDPISSNPQFKHQYISKDSVRMHTTKMRENLNDFDDTMRKYN